MRAEPRGTMESNGPEEGNDGSPHSPKVWKHARRSAGATCSRIGALLGVVSLLLRRATDAAVVAAVGEIDDQADKATGNKARPIDPPQHVTHVTVGNDYENKHHA